MLKNYMIVAYRNLLRHKLYSIINVGGLAIGLAACILIFLFVRDELSYDDWGPDTDRLYKIETAHKQIEGTFPFRALSPGRLRDPLAENYQSEFEAVARIYQMGHILKRGNDVFREDIWFADSDFFNVFEIDMISGDRDDIFHDNASIIINQSMAQKYFGDQNPVGEIITPVDGFNPYKVVGIMADLPEKTHLDFEFITMFDPSRHVDEPWMATYWLSSNAHTYVKLAEHASAEAIEQSFPAFLTRNVIRSEHPGLNTDPNEIFRMRLMPVSDIHLHSTGLFQMKQGGDIKVVYSFSVIALLILFIASINFINLSTARASTRAREIALRKVVGANRRQLITQFIGETGLMVVMALLLALTIVELTLPWFNSFVTKLLSLEYGSDPTTGFMLAGLLIVVILGAGMLPAVQITRFHPATVLRANNSKTQGGNFIRVILVTIQFAISIGLMTTTFVVYQQTEYAASKDLGFETENRVMLERMYYSVIEPVADTIKNEIDALPGVLNSSYSGRTLPLQGFWDVAIDKQGMNTNQINRIELVPGGLNYLDFYGVELIAGRMFGEEYLADYQRPTEVTGDTIFLNTIINRTAVSYLNYDTPEDSLGASFNYMDFDGNQVQMTVVGVVEDMHVRTLRDEVEPLALHVNEDNRSVLNIHLSEFNQQETIAAIESIWRTHVPTIPISMTFLEEKLDRLYSADKNRGQMFGYFSLFAILVSCLGLFGLSAFTAEQRTKEIGVRKVYGANNPAIVKLLVWQFSKPVLVANLIAWPLVWYIMQDWLSGYAYRIDLTLLPFAVASLIALCIAWSTVSIHALRVARTNPIHALRHE